MAVVAFESSSLSSLAQSLTSHPNAPVRIAVLSRGPTCLQDQDVELNLSMLQVLYSHKVHHEERWLMDLILKPERKTAFEASESQNEIFYCGVMQCTIQLAYLCGAAQPVWNHDDWLTAQKLR